MSDSGQRVDKSLLVVDGTPMVLRVTSALQFAGADPICCIGGSVEALNGLGLTVAADEYPGDGPLGGIITALSEAERSSATIVLVAACDHPWLSGTTATTLMHTLRDSDGPVSLVYPVDKAGRAALLLALRVADAAGPARQLFADGERSVRSLIGALDSLAIPGLDPRSLRDVDEPSDLTGPDK